MATSLTPERSSPAADIAAITKAKEAEKLAQIIQHFFTKAALTIVSSRVNLPQTVTKGSTQIKSNRWFNLILDESETLQRELDGWATADVVGKKPPALIVEIYLDAAELTRNQTLVVIDERGRRWDVCEALASPSASSTASRHRKSKTTQVVIEQWKVSLGDPEPSRSTGSTDSMPNVYKKAVVMFRTLYTYMRFLPAWKFDRRIAKQPATLTSLRPKYRIVRGDSSDRSKDLLGTSLYPTAEPTTEGYHFEPTYSPAGPLCIDVTYRTNCDFRVDDSEALLSSHFNHMDDGYFLPSLDDKNGQDLPYLAGGKEVGSLPLERAGMKGLEQSQAYGSMSTFHNVGGLGGTSPISALRAARELTSGTPDSSPKQTTIDRGLSPRPAVSSRTPDTGVTFQRRTSVSFQPFKAGSLSSSPANISSSPKGSSGKIPENNAGGSQGRGSSPLTAEPQTSSNRALTIGPEIAVASPGSGSPRGAGRYSSSFGHRRQRFSSGGGGTIKGEEDNSSGKTSLASSHQPGSGILAEGEAGSTGSVQNDEDDNISDFIKLVEQNKDLRSFNRTDEASRDASAKRTAAALSKFKNLQSSHAALTESLTSSAMLQRSSSSSSRQLSTVPPMLAGASVSTSSSPGKPISPHTPHYPAVPSRLSMPATVQESDPRIGQAHPHQERDRAETHGSETASESTAHGPSSTAIDIPTSPQHHPFIRRSSSAAHRERVIEETFGMRSASVPSEDRDVMNLSELLTMQDASVTGDGTPAVHLTAVERTSSRSENPTRGTLSTSNDSAEGDRRLSVNSGSAGSGRPSLRYRLSRGAGRGSTSSFSTRGGSSALVEDDEPFLFAMSDIGHSRRSLEEAQRTDRAENNNQETTR